MKRVLLHCLTYVPDGSSTAYIYKDIVLALKQQGMDVIVLTTTPHNNKIPSQLAKQPLKWKIPGVLKESEHDGVRVLHVPQKKFRHTWLRLIGFVYWHLISFFTVLFLKKTDVIISPSPPLTLGLLNVWLGKLKGAKVIYNVQEVYPDLLGKTSGLVYEVLKRMEKYIYDRSDAVTTIDEVFYRTIAGRFEHPEKLRIIPNFVDTSIYRPLDRPLRFDEDVFIANDHLKLLYAGNIGIVQDWDMLVELARETRDEKIDFYVIGEGVMQEHLKKQIMKYGLDNIRVLSYQPREMIPDIIAFSDIQFIFMDSKMAAQGFPSKVYTIMASARPLLVCSPQNTPIVNFLAPIGCAKIIPETDVASKVKSAKRWLTEVTKNELAEMGRRGYEEIAGKYSKEAVTKKYVELIENV